jgi:hypothetical protein
MKSLRKPEESRKPKSLRELKSLREHSILEGHGFSRAVSSPHDAALAAEVRFSPSDIPGESRKALGTGVDPGGDGSSGTLPRKDGREPQGALQIPPLRFAPVGMTRGEG